MYPPSGFGQGTTCDMNAAIFSLAFSNPSSLAVLALRVAGVAAPWPILDLLTLHPPFHALSPFRRATHRFHAQTRPCSQDLASQAVGIGEGARAARCCSRTTRSFHTVAPRGRFGGARQH